MKKFLFYAVRVLVVLAVIIGFICVADDPDTLNWGFAKIKLLGFGLIFLAMAVAGSNSHLFPAEEINEDERL